LLIYLVHAFPPHLIELQQYRNSF